MQCPRCGLQNQQGVTACARCGLPAPIAVRTQQPWPPAPIPVATQQPWPPTPYAAPQRPGRSPAGGTVALIAVAVAALLCLGYAGWALTARRGIFADIRDGSTVTVTHARASDRADTLFLVVAGVVALSALVLWVIRLLSRQAEGGGFGVGALAVCMLGVVTVAVGLFLTGRVADASGLSAQGDRGVTATTVIGVGFLAQAVGLLLGSLVIRGRE